MRKGFTLIELLVVVAILGILAAVGIQAYNGYVSSAKKKSAENIMQQIALAQTEYYSTYGLYFETGGCGDDKATTTTSDKINLLLESNVIKEDVGYYFCTENHADKDYIIKANAIKGECWRKFDGKGNFDPAEEWNCG